MTRKERTELFKTGADQRNRIVGHSELGPWLQRTSLGRATKRESRPECQVMLIVHHCQDPGFDGPVVT